MSNLAQTIPDVPTPREPNDEEEKICRVWGDAYDTYLWSYLMRGPVASTDYRRDPVSASPVRRAAYIEPDALRDREFSNLVHLRDRAPWEDSLYAPLSRLKEVAASTSASGNTSLAKFVGLCAWQAVSTLQDVEEVPACCEDLLTSLATYARQPNILPRITDINANLQIPRYGFPTYTLEMVVNVNFEQLSAPLLKASPESGERQARLLCPGPVWLKKDKKAQAFSFLFPERIGSPAAWSSRAWSSAYEVDMSDNNSTLRFDFSLLKPEGSAAERLLEEDRGYFQMRKKAGYVNATEIVVQRSIWFGNAAYGMNATLMPVFRMIVESRVLRELSILLQPDALTTESKSLPMQSLVRRR